MPITTHMIREIAADIAINASAVTRAHRIAEVTETCCLTVKEVARLEKAVGERSEKAAALGAYETSDLAKRAELVAEAGGARELARWRKLVAMMGRTAA